MVMGTAGVRQNTKMCKVVFTQTSCVMDRQTATMAHSTIAKVQ